MGTYPNWEVIFFNVATPPQTETETETETQPEPLMEQNSGPHWPWLWALTLALIALVWIYYCVENYRVEPPVGPPAQVESLDDDMGNLIKLLEETLVHCQQYHDESCVSAINLILDDIYDAARKRGMNLGDLLKILPSIQQIVIAECSDGVTEPYIIFIHKWEYSVGIDEFGGCPEWIFVKKVDGEWEIYSYQISRWHRDAWVKFIKREGLPSLPNQN